MKNRLLIFSLLLIAVIAGFRFLYPEKTAKIQSQASELIENKLDYSELIMTMGEQLSESGIKEDIAEVFRIFEFNDTVAGN